MQVAKEVVDQATGDTSPMTFKKLTKLAKEQIAKQEPVTLEKAREQAKRVEARISGKARKKTD